MTTSTLHLNNPVPSNGAVVSSLGGRHTVTVTLAGVGAISCVVQAWGSEQGTDSRKIGAPVTVSGTTAVSQTLTFDADCKQFWLELVKLSPACKFNATVENDSSTSFAGPLRVAGDLVADSAAFAGPVVAPGLDARPIRAVVIGDSHHALLGPTITTGQRTSQQASYLWWMLHALDWSIPVVANLAVGGRRTDQIAATVDAALALRPDIVFESSVTNDLLQNYRWAAQRAGKEAYCDRIVQSGAALVLFIAPCASTAADDIQDTIQHRQWAYNFAATRRNVWIIDGLAATVDPASATLSAKSGMLPDNVHLSMVAARTVGEIAAQLGIFATLRGAQLPPFSPYETTAKDPDCAQLYDNPGLTGSVALSGDGVSGVGPTAWNVSRGGSAGTFVGSLVTADGWTDFVATMAGCVNGTNFQRQLNPPAPLLAALVGKTVVLEWEQEYAGVSGVAEDYLQVYTPAVSKSACVAVDLGIIAVSQLIPQADGVRRYRSGPIEIPAGTTVLRLNWRTYWLSAGGGVIKFRKLRMWDASKLAVVSLG